MPDPDDGMASGEYGDDFKAFVRGSLEGLANGQNRQAADTEEQGKRITNMHVRQDKAEADTNTVIELLRGPMDKPHEGLVSQVQANTKARKGLWKWITGTIGSLITTLIIAWALGAFKSG